MSWRDKVARFFGLDGDRARPDGIKPWPDDIDPIGELARIINESQDRDAKDGGRFDALARTEQLNRAAGNQVQSKTNRNIGMHR